MSTDPTLLFGIIALQSGRLTREGLDLALAEQGKTAAPLGEICRQRGLLSTNQVHRILEVQREGALAEAETRLGILAVRNGFVAEEALGSALDRQRLAARRLGEILLDDGRLTSQALQALLSAQSRLRGVEPPGDEPDSETREMALPTVAPDSGPDPRAWLIHETAEGRPETFPIGRTALLGRLPTHDVPVPDMGSSRHHARLEFAAGIRRHVLTDLDSRNGTFVNGERVLDSRALKPGDLIQIGDTVFRYAVGPGISLGMTPAAPLIPPPPPPAAVPARKPLGEMLRRAASRIAPGIHPQRQLFIAGAWVGMLATFLPWTHGSDGSAALGVPGLGLAVLLLFLAVLVLSFLGERPRAPEGRLQTGTLAAAGIAACLSVGRLIFVTRSASHSGGIGLYLAALMGTAMSLYLWLSRGANDAATLPDPRRLWGSVKGAAAIAGDTTVRIFRGMGGKKAHEKAVLFRKRDELLRRVGLAARQAAIAGDEADRVARAEQELGESLRRVEGLKEDTLPKDSILARHELKNSELRLERSLQELGRSVIDRGVPLEGERTRIAEVMLLDQRVRELD
ncbi:MAG TPA: FHA domain-containing protein [Planctomycetota bacterium]|nr:FHA domain-containing protein [Planctomycetota bacterium]